MEDTAEKKDLAMAIKLYSEEGDESHGIIVVDILIRSTMSINTQLHSFTTALAEDTAALSHALTSN
eukprot:2283273-Ditylum_brightwellii.AAC.1